MLSTPSEQEPSEKEEPKAGLVASAEVRPVPEPVYSEDVVIGTPLTATGAVESGMGMIGGFEVVGRCADPRGFIISGSRQARSAPRPPAHQWPHSTPATPPPGAPRSPS